MSRKIYLTSSWRNPYQPEWVDMLREWGHEVYDFRNPSSTPDIPHALPDAGFGWEQIHSDWKSWTPEQFAQALEHPVAQEGFAADFAALEWADTCVLLLPCGRSAHLEGGWMIGQQKPTAIKLNETDNEPELMYLMADHIATNAGSVFEWLESLDA